jgi:hypothetical protein
MNVPFSCDNLCPQKMAEIITSDLQLNYHNKLWVDRKNVHPRNDFQMKNPKGVCLCAFFIPHKIQLINGVI